MSQNTNALFDNFTDLFSNLDTSTVEAEQGVTATPIAQATVAPAAVQASQSIEILPGNSANLVSGAQAKLQMISKEMNDKFVERDEVIKCMMLALVSSQSMLMLGNPGTAKSAITYELCGRIENGSYFQWMLNKTSDPSELLGPYSIKAMEQDRFLRITTGKLPEAHIAFIDECFKANAPVLNTLLPVMNEKIFYNDGKANDIPLMTMIGASNEGPEDESLSAFYDRFLFRINVHYVKDAANKKRMYTNYVNDRRGLGNMVKKTTITIDEIKALTEASKNLLVPKDVINKFVSFINSLDKQNIQVSDRRQNECLKIMQASAIINGRQQVSVDDFKALIYVLWEKEEHIPFIESTILKMVNPFDDKIKEFRESFMTIKKDVDDTTNEQEKATKALEAKSGIEKITSKLNRVINEAVKEGKDTTEFVQLRDDMIKYSGDVVQIALGSSLGIDDSMNLF